MPLKLNRRQLVKLGGAAALMHGAPRVSLAQGKSRVIRAVMHTALRVTDPLVVPAWTTRNHGYNIYDTLFSMDSKLNYKPQMVDSFDVSGDGLTYTFHLRSGLKFHDGAPVTSEDVIASLKRWGARDQMGIELIASTGELTAVDRQTFRLVLKRPFGHVLAALGKPSSAVPFIMPARIAATPPSQQITEYVGSGPFRFVPGEFKPGIKAVYERNPDYLARPEPADGLAGGKLVKVDRYEWIHIADFQTSLNALVNNEIDYFENPTHEMIPDADKLGVKLFDYNPAGFSGYCRPNWLSPLIAKQEIRQAIFHATNQRDWLDAQIGDPKYYRASSAMFVPDMPYGTEAGWNTNADVAAAKALLTKGGYKGEPITLVQVSDAPIISPLVDVTAQALRQIGMNVKLVSLDWLSVLARRAKQESGEQGGWDLVHATQAAVDIFNPIINAHVMTIGKTGPFGWAEDKPLMDLRQSFIDETDLAKQKAIAETIQQRAYEVVTHIPTGMFRQPAMHRPNLSGFIPALVPVFWNVEKA